MLLLSSIIGCATANKVAFTSLDTVGSTENAAMVQAAKAYHSGQMSLKTWQSTTNAHALFLISYDAAVTLAAVNSTNSTSAPAPAVVLSNASTVVNLSTNK